MAVSLGELAVRFGCELRGDPARASTASATLANAQPRALAFLAESRYRAQLAATRAAAVVAGCRSAADACPTAALICNNPHATYARIAACCIPRPPSPPGFMPRALVASECP